ncbi:TonB-dependent receptor [Sediminicola luteus]|uniref:TonB-dependent siderophore receptor n=1 Tax=Sediminicola luteus TaxID=319238 RepID=A0A2A4G9J5_9FLAO|nr:TonB-dependent receptor [Sediminicola luteus]PCE64432.1 hypothetical protein B7P33_09085 [Sediminicola luteus]
MRLALLATFLLCFSLSWAQNASVSGNITAPDGEALTGVTVQISALSKGTFTDEQGDFTLTGLPAGNHSLTLSYIGFKNKEIAIALSEGQQLQLEAQTLFEGNELLQEVVLTGERQNKFSRKETAYVSKLPLKDIENSQVYTTITSEILESQVVTNFDEALNNATGVGKLWEATGRAPGNGTGYFSARGFATQPRLVDGLPGFTFSAVDPSYIERIEVIKGPSATLFGSTETSLGGLINVVTKKPYEGFGGSITYTGGSFNTHRISADVNTPISTSEKTFFRVTTSFLTKDSFQDAGFTETFFVAPSLTHRFNNKLTLKLGVEYSRTKQTNPSMLFLRRGAPMVSRNIEQMNVDPNKSFTSDDIHLTSPILNTRAVVDYKLTDRWTSQTVAALNYSEAKGYYQYNIDGGPMAILFLSQLTTNPALEPLQPILGPMVNPMLLEANALLQQDAFTRIFDKRDANATNFNIQQNFVGDVKIGDMRNRVVFGLDYLSKAEHSRNQSGNPVLTTTSNFPQLLGFFANPPSPPVPAEFVPTLQALGQQTEATYQGLPYFDAFIDPRGNVIESTFTPGATYTPNKANLDQIFAQVPVNDIKVGSQVLAAYVSDVINVAPNLTVNVGLRLDHFIQDGNKAVEVDDYTKTNFSPNAGFVYQPIMNRLSVFGNYQTGFLNQNPIINPAGSIRPDGTVAPEPWVTTLDPVKANQYEAGIKTNLVGNKLNLGVSYYYINVKDRATSDPRVPLLPQTVDIAETVSKGIELEVNSNPFPGMNLRASYSYNDSEVTDAYSKLAGEVITPIQGYRPEEAGPEKVYNFWADYRIQSTNDFLSRIGIGAGFNGASEHYTLNNAISGQFELPSYTIFNASLYYDAEKFRIGIKANNISDEEYYRGWSTINAQAPFNMLGTVSYKF